MLGMGSEKGNEEPPGPADLVGTEAPRAKVSLSLGPKGAWF